MYIFNYACANSLCWMSSLMQVYRLRIIKLHGCHTLLVGNVYMEICLYGKGFIVLIFIKTTRVCQVMKLYLQINVLLKCS